MAKNPRFCPNCGSTNVEPDTRHTNQLGEMIFNQNKWFCRECDYTGLMPEGDPEDFDQEFSEKVDFEPEEQRKLDTDAGRAYWKYLLYVTLPALALYAVFKIFF